MLLLIKGKLLIDGTGTPPIPDGAILVEEGRIVEVGKLENLHFPSDTRIINRRHETLLPGLVDSHIHVAIDSTIDESVSLQQERPDALKALRGYMSLQKDLMSGVTTARSLGDGCDVDRIIRDAIVRGEINGPRILACVLALRPSHGTAPKTAICADGIDELRRRTREAIARGADVIKIFASNIIRGNTHLDYLRGDLTRVAAYTKEEMAVVAEEAHRVGIKVAAHAIGGPALRWALQAGIDSVEHANLIDEEDIEVFLETGGFLSDPNLHLFFDPEIGFEGEGNRTHKWGELPEWWHEKVRLAREQTRTVMSRAVKMGVKFALGTDLNHGGLWKEAKYFVQALGATEMEAILAITKNGAKLCGLEDQIGTLEKGKSGDIISVNGNPLERIECLQDVQFVVKEGRVVKG